MLPARFNASSLYEQIQLALRLATSKITGALRRV